jgi:hypothetical protein
MLGGIELSFAEKATTVEGRQAAIDRARRFYEESELVAARTKQSLSFMFAFIGLIKIEILARTSGVGLKLMLEEAIKKDFISNMDFAGIEDFIAKSLTTIGSSNSSLARSLQDLITEIDRAKKVEDQSN